MLHVVNYSYIQERPGNSWTYHQELVKLSYIQYLQKQCLFQYFSDYSVVFLTLVSIQLYLQRHVPSDDLCLKAFHSKRGQLHLQTLFLLPSRSLVQLKMLRNVQERNEASSVAQNKRPLILTDSTYKITLFFRQHSQHKINLFHNYWPCWSHWCCKIGLSWCLHSADKIQKIFPEHCLFVPRFVTLKTTKMCTLTKMKEHAIILQLFEGSIMIIRL